MPGVLPPERDLDAGQLQGWRDALQPHRPEARGLHPQDDGLRGPRDPLRSRGDALMLATIEQQAEARIRRHRARLLMTAPFYGAVGAELELVIDPDCDTAWTDGKRIGFGADFALRLPAEHLRGVIAHEILHVAMRHNYRRGDRDHALWNEACDYAINSVLIRDGFALPEDALLDDRFDKLSVRVIIREARSSSS
ncbi:MAG: hypothetical protein EBY60_08195 [Actinobacteria bacterium]|nr:hypothetical protein [Actinomycetota bacterium]